MTEVRELKISAPTVKGRYTIAWVSKFTAGKEGAVLDRTPMCAAALAPAVRRVAPAGEWRLSYRIVLQPEAFTAKALAEAVSEWRRMAYSRG